MRKTLWSPAEDEMLKECVLRYGCRNWKEIARRTGLGRCPKSCRLRWFNYLRPDLKRTPFSPLEAALLLHLHAAFGNRWSKIASHLPGRSDNDVKNFWHTLSRRAASCNVDMALTWRDSHPVSSSVVTDVSDIIADGVGGAPLDIDVEATTSAIVDHVRQLLLREQQQRHGNPNSRRGRQKQPHHANPSGRGPEDNSEALRRGKFSDEMKTLILSDYEDGLQRREDEEDEDEEEEDDEDDEEEEEEEEERDIAGVMMMNEQERADLHILQTLIMNRQQQGQGQGDAGHESVALSSAASMDAVTAMCRDAAQDQSYWNHSTTASSAAGLPLPPPPAPAAASYHYAYPSYKPPEGLDLIVWNLLNPNQSVPSTWREN